MKKAKYIIGIFILFLIIAVLYIRVEKQENVDTLKSEFNRWESTEINDNEKKVIIEKLISYLRHNNLDKEQIEFISPYLKSLEYEDFRIIKYIENPELYGNSAKYSYYILQTDDNTELIINQDSINIADVVKFDEKEYLFIAEDYKFSNMSGIRLFRLKIADNNPVIEKDIIEKELLPDDLSLIADSIYSDGHNLHYEIKGKRIILNNELNEYELILQPNNKYSIEQITD